MAMRKPSSSLLSVGQRRAEMESETVLGQGSKVKEEASLNDFPSEVLVKILEFVDTPSLFTCRLVNCQWSEISSWILRNRTDAKMTFTFEDGQFFQKRANNLNEKQSTSLKSFLLCMKKSENCPFARFVFFCEDKSSYFDYADFFRHEDYKGFLSAIDESQENPNQQIKIKSLELNFGELLRPLTPLIEHLRDLLFYKIPHLEEFGLDFSSMLKYKDVEMKLFPETIENKVVELPHLKVIHFNETMILNSPGLLKDLLGAARSLRKIELYNRTCRFSPELYDFLHPLGKFHLSKSFKFHPNKEFLVKMKERPDFTRDLLKLELEELTTNSFCRLNDADLIEATNFLASLFESSKNSLKKLTMRHFSSAQDLQFPRFQNLNELIVEPGFRQDSFLSPGVGSLDIFPAVLELDLSGWNWALVFSCKDSIPVFPRLQTLRVTDLGFTGDSVPILTLLCQNFKHLKIHRHIHGTQMAPTINFLDVGCSIWTHLKKLESLEIDVDMDSPENNKPFALDSCFTGISLKNCQRLYELKNPQKTLKILGFQVKISSSKLTAARKHPSILDMTNLKRLKINPYSGKTMFNSPDFFRDKLTWISEEYAFKFLPHLKPEPKSDPVEHEN